MRSKIKQTQSAILRRVAGTKTGTCLNTTFHRARLRELINRGDLISLGGLVKLSPQGERRIREENTRESNLH